MPTPSVPPAILPCLPDRDVVPELKSSIVTVAASPPCAEVAATVTTCLYLVVGIGSQDRVEHSCSRRPLLTHVD